MHHLCHSLKYHHKAKHYISTSPPMDSVRLVFANPLVISNKACLILPFVWNMHLWHNMLQVYIVDLVMILNILAKVLFLLSMFFLFLLDHIKARIFWNHNFQNQTFQSFFYFLAWYCFLLRSKMQNPLLLFLIDKQMFEAFFVVFGFVVLFVIQKHLANHFQLLCQKTILSDHLYI